MVLAAMATPRTSGLRALPVDPWAAGLSQRRLRALEEINAELGPDHRGPDQPAIALRDYGPGCLGIGIAGPIDLATAEGLQMQLGEVREQGRHELLVTLAGLGPWHPQLARVLARARIQHLSDGADVDFLDVPDALAVELGPAQRTTFLGVETSPADPSGTATV